MHRKERQKEVRTMGIGTQGHLRSVLMLALTIGVVGVIVSMMARADAPSLAPTSAPPATAEAALQAPVDHALFDRLLKKYVQDGWVNYAGIRTEESVLDEYLLVLAHANPYAMSREEKLAFYINAYNAAAIKGILNGRSAKGRARQFMFFRRDTYRIGAESISLDRIEHKILRAQFDEPRIHFAIVCASKSCPPQASQAFTAEHLETMLDERGRAFLQSHERNRLDPEKDILYLSSIFKWFTGDFLKHTPSLQAFVAQYMTKEDQEYLATHTPVIAYLPYDWDLNGDR